MYSAWLVWHIEHSCCCSSNDGLGIDVVDGMGAWTSHEQLDTEYSRFHWSYCALPLNITLG